MLKFAFPPTQNIKFAFPPTQNRNASQWNIGCVGSLALGLCVGYVCTFHIFCVDFICVGKPTQTQFSVEYGLKSAVSAYFVRAASHHRAYLGVGLLR